MRLLFFAITLTMIGCTTTERVAYQFRDGSNGGVLVGREASLTTGPRIHSWLDPRHHDTGARAPVVVAATTDEQGIATFEWQVNLGAPYVWLGSDWVAFCPADWQPMKHPDGSRHEKTKAAPPQVRMTAANQRLQLADDARE